MAKTKAASQSFVYPPHQGYRSGGKVSWHYYTNHADAVLANDTARMEAMYKELQGYDFGHQSPGNKIKRIDSEGEFKGMYEVCVP